MENKTYEVESNNHSVQIIEYEGVDETFYEYYDCGFYYE